MVKLDQLNRAGGSARKGRLMAGVVVRKSGDKTVAVQITRLTRHPLYLKKMVRTKKYLVHDPANAALVGDEVTIGESRPWSRHKRWQVVTINQSAGREEE